MALTGWGASWGWGGGAMLPVPGPALQRVLLLWGDSHQSEQLPQPYSRRARRKSRRAFRLLCPWEGVGTNAHGCAGRAGIWGELAGLSCSQWCQISLRDCPGCVSFKGAGTQCPSLTDGHALGRSLRGCSSVSFLWRWRVQVITLDSRD